MLCLNFFNIDIQTNYMRMTVAIFLFAVIGFSSCEIKKGAFYATPVPGWTIDSSYIEGNQRLKMHSVANDTDAAGLRGITIMVEKSALSLNAYKSQLEKGVEKRMFIFEKRAEGHVRPKKDEFTWARYAMRQTKGAKPVEQCIYYLKKTGNVYIIICTTVLNGLDKMEKEIDGVLHSFKVL
jgi:hypothetical protein